MSKIEALRAMDDLGRIVEAIDRIHRYVQDLTEQGFLADEKTQDAVVRNFEVLGKAARNIECHHAALASTHAEVPWAELHALCNRVAHGYFKVDCDLVWKTIHADLPDLRTQIAALMTP